MLCKREASATRHQQQRTRGYNGFSIFIFLRRFVATTLYETYFGDSQNDHKNSFYEQVAWIKKNFLFR